MRVPEIYRSRPVYHAIRPGEPKLSKSSILAQFAVCCASAGRVIQWRRHTGLVLTDTGMAMADVLEEITNPGIDRDHVLRRVDDWARRIDALYRQIAGWLPAGWTFDQEGAIRMSEELMQKFGVPARELPILQLLQDGKRSAHIEPRGLWIIGANGRLDLFSRSGHHVISDAAENFQPPDWRIAPLSNRRKRQPLDQETFVTAL